MDFIRGMLPYIKVPRLNDISISDGLCGCVACHPFGKPRRWKGVWGGGVGNPSQEVTTISSLMDKLKADVRKRRRERRPATTEDTVVYGPHQDSSKRSIGCSSSYKHPQPGTGGSSFSQRRNFGKDGSRPVGFSYDMKHEKFTPCEVNRECSHVDDATTRAGHGEGRFSSYAFGGNRNGGSAIVAPPRRKRFSRRLLSDSSTDGSLDSVVNREIWNNTRNLKLNQNINNISSGKKTAQPLIITTHSESSIKRSNQNDVNHNHKLNNKSGCSRIDVDSDSVRLNETHFMQLDRSRVNKVVINRQDEVVTYCENKVYYKNTEPDEYGDEVIVCESIINVEPVASKPIPDDATYTRLYSDSLYRDSQAEDDGVSSSSFDVHFDKIVRLKSDTNLQIRSPFQRFMLKRQEQKQTQKRSQEERQRSSTWRKDLGGIIPVHRPANESFESIKVFVAPSRTREPDFNWTSTAGAQIQMQMQNPGCIRI